MDCLEWQSTLMARKVKDKRVLKLIRRYLSVGIMEGGPLSPLLSNILLDDLDRELEKRGHCFCRYADDCNVYVQTERAAQRAMAGLTQFLEEKRKATNGRGAWWNAGASHMNAAVPKAWFDRLQLVSLADPHRRFQRVA
ncbi:reverse transcriptase domain-containing protein [Algiphilus sp. W345]|uniref:Reverse transcriptase domain-containing protein n=1 Tax=Banduia mediterranea TaxID=3075609 RepID=A0ABU2WN25_9GAMM|nr:reverse transcriptase domain-containing protein [Algiphilus sp. W345]MDT0499278.1 reverse transcriptase domain-containing protein [Algiphilus sp. W345]